MKGNLTNYPRQAQLFISEVCMEGCDYCPYTQMPQKEKKKLLVRELSIEQWQQAVEFLNRWLGIKLFFLIGGEPTAKKGVERLIDFMSHKLSGVNVVLSTSGISVLRDKKQRQTLVRAGANKFVVSIDRLDDKSKKTDWSDLVGREKGSERKSLLGLRFLQILRQDFPKVDFILSANSIINKKTLPDILKTYFFLAKQQIYLNLCPEQTLCFDHQTTALDGQDQQQLRKIVRELVKIKQQENNFLIPSTRFLQLLPTLGIGQMYKCSSAPFPLTLHLASDGTIPFCIWRRGELANQFNVMDWVRGKKDYSQWLKAWQNDQGGRGCSCSWSFIDRVGGFGISRGREKNNFWHNLI
ncbi:MAG TPA: radical SAM protein [Patescibacteria group bacterium]|nr:radical SAM protein [Patescibacteria group bacterium]